MVMCQRCGRCLTWPKSLERGYGPVCWKKIHQAYQALITYSPPEDLELEKRVLMKLHKTENLIVSSTSSKNHRRREREYKKRGYSLHKDYAYHSYTLMFEKVKANRQSEFVAICYDELSGTKRGEKSQTQMTISLMEKPKKDAKVRVCPDCGQSYSGFPALSRKDNETDICPDCGQKEALLSYFGRK